MSEVAATDLKALIFDVDGTLAETEEVHRQAYNEIFAAAGLGWHWSREDYHWLHRTTGGKERMRRYRDEIGDTHPSVAEIAEVYRQKTLRYGALVESGDVELRAGVRELVETAQQAGLRLAVATTTGSPNVDALCRACWGRPAREMFEVIVAGDDVAAKKPAPDAFLHALDRLDLHAEEAVAFEDSHNGLMSAVGAGLRVLVTPSIYTQEEDFAAASWCRKDLSGVTVSRDRALVLRGG